MQFRGLMALSLALVMMRPAQADYTFASVDFPDVISNWAYGINNTGQIVGSTFSFGFLLSDDKYTRLDQVPGAYDTFPVGINDYGEIVGHYRDASGTVHGFLLSNGEYTSLDVPGATGTVAHRINNAGQIVGNYSDDTRTHGFLLSDGEYTPIDVPGAVHTYAIGINNAGQIVGYFMGDVITSVHGFLLTDCRYTTLDAPGADVIYTTCTAINDVGQIIGGYTDIHGVGRAFLLSDGEYTTIDVPPGWNSTAFYGLNNAGQIVGWYYDRGYIVHGFVATPN